jgi:prevent-host-death family protein
MSPKPAEPTAQQVSIASARNNLPALVRAAEAGRPVEITRRGQPVAVLISRRDFERMGGGQGTWWEAIEDFRSRHDLRQLNVEEIFAGVRDRSPGRPESNGNT